MAAEKNSTLWQLLWGFAGELARVDFRMDDLITESIMTGADELITEWEEEFGIPEEGTQLALTLADRIKTLLAKLVAVGQQDPGYFEDIAAKLGYTIEVEQFQPFFVGFSTVGATVGNLAVLFRWMVWIVIEAGINWNIEKLIYNIRKNKPAHTEVFFEFQGAEFSRAFHRGSFNAIRQYDGSWYDDRSFGREFSSAFANAYDYDGVNMTGPFSQGFDLSFDMNAGGGFENTAFDNAFNTPA
jgi:uncharacterized protein YmfQ (DUF2313 family)